MKKLAVAGLVAMVLTLVGCGWHDHGHGNINGTWTAVLSAIRISASEHQSW
jgi:outer membrane lipopolysaccharide assembly protein LptE/RlpB